MNKHSTKYSHVSLNSQETCCYIVCTTLGCNCHTALSLSLSLINCDCGCYRHQLNGVASFPYVGFPCVWFGMVVTSTKFSYVKSGWNWIGLVITFGSTTQSPQPCHPSVGHCNEYWQWFQPPLWKKRLVLHSRRLCNQDCLHKPKFHLARHVLTRSTCWAHAFWLCLACRTARRTRLAQHVERVELCRDVTWGAKWDLGYTGWSRSIWTGRPADVGFPIFTQCDSVHIAADSKEVTLLIVLDLSVAFDTVCHSTLTKRLQTEFGVSGTALSWIQSYL